MKNVIEQYEILVAPAVKFNRLAAANLEKLVNLQLASLEAYTDLVLGRLKAAAEITDVKGLQVFYADQVQFANALRRKALEDSKTLNKLAIEVKAELDQLVKDRVVELKSAA